MAPAMAIADPRVGKLRYGLGFGEVGNKKGAAVEEELRRRNEELEREVRERREREEEMGRELERTRERLKAVEEAEERLCSQLGEFEAEAVAEAMAYQCRIKALSTELARVHKILNSSSDHRVIFAVHQ